MDYNFYQPEEEKSSEMFMSIRFRLVSVAVFMLASGIAFFIVTRNADEEIVRSEPEKIEVAPSSPVEEEVVESEGEKPAWHFTPGPISMDLIKKMVVWPMDSCPATGEKKKKQSR